MEGPELFETYTRLMALIMRKLGREATVKVLRQTIKLLTKAENVEVIEDVLEESIRRG